MGTKEKHTAGPWLYTECDHDVGHISSVPEGFGDIATAWPYEGNAKANARLIAAAPDLLEALKEMKAAVFGTTLGDEPDVYRDYDRLSSLASLVIGAVDKAEGR